MKGLPTKIHSISNPRWKDTLHWTKQGEWARADVDHDWRIWTRLENGRPGDEVGCSVVRNKGDHFNGKWFDTLALGLASLDYKETK